MIGEEYGDKSCFKILECANLSISDQLLVCLLL